MIPTEHQEAVIVADWLRQRDVFFFHPANEQKLLSTTGKSKFAILRSLKSEGFLPGVSDFIIITPPPLYPDYRGVAIELKRREKSKPSPLQIAFIDKAQDCGWYGGVCYGADDAIDRLKGLGF